MTFEEIIENCSLEDIDNLDISDIEIPDNLDKWKIESSRCSSYEQAIKLIINSIYGAFGNEWFHFYNVSIAETVTLQGQDAIKFTEGMLDKYFKKFFHKDKKLHKLLGVPDDFVVAPIKGNVWKYTDTDSFEDGIILTSDGPKLMSEWYEEELKSNGKGEGTLAGHESTSTDLKVANYKDGKIYMAPVKRLIRHKVNKPKWKLKTKSGKEVIVTEDHSLIVFRNNEQIEIKPKDIKITDKILVVHDIYKNKNECTSNN